MRRYQPNAFLAKPAKFRGRLMHGVISHPGFHTTSRYSIACSYANAKVDDLTPSEWTATLKKGWSHSMFDYPVVASLVMNGFQPLPDYDAFEYWADPIKTVLEEFERYGEDSTVDAFADFIQTRDTATTGEANPVGAVDALAIILDGFPNQQAGDRILDYLTEADGLNPGSGDAILRHIMRHPEEPTFLMEVAKQMRYMEDVHESRICQVDYMKPFFDHLFPHYDDPEWEARRLDERIANIEAAGYAVVTLADVYDSMDPTQITTVYEIPPKSIRTPDMGQLHFGDWHTSRPRIEYHGTSYRNLLKAAPHLCAQLPKPPPPYEDPGD